MKTKSLLPGPHVSWSSVIVVCGQEGPCTEAASVQSSWVTTATGGLLGVMPGGRGPHIPFSTALEARLLAAPALALGADWEGGS